jgi:hypothetical protein
VIHPPGHRLLKAAGRTPPGLAIDSHSFGLNTGNEEEHGFLLAGVLELWSAGVLEWQKKTITSILHYSTDPWLPAHLVVPVNLKKALMPRVPKASAVNSSLALKCFHIKH